MRFLVDGAIIKKDGRDVTSDINGKYEIDVPVGIHTVQAELDGHVFQAEGLYKDNFIENNHNLSFIDSTLVKVLGRVVGGSVESSYSIGYGKSKNNIGQAVIELIPELPLGPLVPKGYDEIVRVDSTEAKNVESTITFERDKIKIVCDDDNGEYIAYLPPISFIPNQILFPNTNINNQPIISQEQRVPYHPNPLMLMYSFKPIDSAQTGPDSIYYQERQDYIYRNGLNFQVTQLEKEPLVFGSKKAIVENPFIPADTNGPVRDTLLLYTSYGPDSVKYSFDYPIFQQYSSYALNIKAFERYINNDNGKNVIDDVPVQDAQISIENNIAMGQGGSESSSKINLDEAGKATYTFTAGTPILAAPYTKVLNVNLTTLGDGKVYNWRKEGLQAIVIGRISQGNDFTTKGPNQVLSILRDPPGSLSTATLSNGYIGTTVLSWGTKGSASEGIKGKISVGKKSGTSMVSNMDTPPGVPGGGTPIHATDVLVKTESDQKIVTIGLGLQFDQNMDNSELEVVSVSSNESFSTSASSNYVGSVADVYIGFATNVVSGIASFLDFELTDNKDSVNGAVKSEYGYFYELSLSQKRFFDDSLSTMFVYPQSHIENNVIPNLIDERNSLITYCPTLADSANFVNTTDDYAYISMQKPTSDFVFTNYTKVLPDTTKRVGKVLVDKVDVNNQDIMLWHNLMAFNELQKIKAKNRKTSLKNISFDAASAYSYSIDSVVDTTHTQTFAFTINLNANLSGETDADAKGKYLDFEIGGSFGGGATLLGKTVGQENIIQTNTRKKTFKYTLGDNNYYDYYSLAIDEYPEDCNGPIFIKMGGQSQCPYEDEEWTKYQEYNEKISEKMIAVEAPTLTITPRTLVDLPAGKETTLEVSLGNNTSVNSFTVYNFNLFDQVTNPDGLEIFMDGIPLSVAGLNYGVTSGATVRKTMKVRQSRKDVLDYNLLFRFSSTCQSSMRDLWPNIEDSARLTLQYKPTCSDVSLYLPNGSTVNTTSTQAVLPVMIKDYNPDFVNFAGVLFESRKAGDQTWYVEKRFIKDTTNKDLYNPAQGDQPLDVRFSSFTYSYDMSANSDALYEVRASTMCNYKNSNIIVSSSVQTIVKDTKLPIVMGTPIPEDGILAFDKDLGIQFSEEINSGLIYSDNLYVEAVMNESRIDHNVGILFDGVQDYAKTQTLFAISGNDFSVEMWVKRDTNRNGTLFSHGSYEEGVSFGFNKNNKLWLKANGREEIVSEETFLDTEWQYIYLAYNAKTRRMTIYVISNNPQYESYAIELDVEPYMNQAPIYIGSKSDRSNNFKGIISKLSFWDIARTDIEIAVDKNQTLSRQSKGLLSYWSLDEGRGNIANDLVRSRHLSLFTSWYIYPQGYALSLSEDAYAKIPVNPNLVRDMEDNYTVEFWMQSKEQRAATLFSCGKGDGSDAGNKSEKMSIALDEQGRLLLHTYGYTVPIDFYIKDSLWHHIAYSVNRGAKAVMYVDGKLVYQTDASNVSGLASTYITIGALYYAKLIGIDGETPLYDIITEQYFKGNIDEVRIWKSALPLDILRLNMYNKLDGNQSDLLAYYPFEAWYQDPIFSNFDIVPALHSQAWKAIEGDTAVLSLGASLNKDYKALKDVLPKQAVKHQWVASKDKIYIDIQEEMYKVEDCTLEITADKIQDVNGNEMENTLHLSVLVDRSNLIWVNKEVEVVEEVKTLGEIGGIGEHGGFGELGGLGGFGAGNSFIITIENKKGVPQTYKIEGNPSWMQIEAKEGVISALQKIDFSVHVDPTIGYGVYEGILRLTGDDKLIENLPYKIHIKAPKPQWELDDRDKENTMLVVGKLKINDVYSENSSDILAAFIDDTCVGITTATYSSIHDTYFMYLTVYGRKTDENKKLQFKVWDAYKGIVYPEIEVWNGELKQDSVCFVADAIIGNVTKPYDFKTTDTREYNYALNKDWNWISIPIDLGNKNSVATVFAALDKDIEEVKSITHFMRQDSIAWIGNLDAQGGLENSKMYKLKLKNKALFNIEGKPIDLASEPIKIEMNWNWLPYLPIDNLSISEAFSSFEPTEGDVIKSQTAFATYTKEQSWVGSLNRLEPGKGYMYRALKPKELTYPSIVGNMTYNLKNAEGVKGGGTTKATDLHWVVDIHKYPNNMNIIAALQKDSTDITSENIQIGAFVNEECRGAAIASFVPEIGKYRVFLTVYGQKENEVLTFKVFDGQEHNSATKLSYVNDGILGSLESPFYVNMQTTNIEQEQSNSASVELYPNPVSTTVFVKSTEPILKMEIFSIDGRKMYSESLSTSETKVKVEHLTSGLYIVKLYFTDGVVTKRFVK